MLTQKALIANAITYQEADDLENFLEGDDWEDENDMPPEIRKTYEIALRHYLHGRLH